MTTHPVPEFGAIDGALDAVRRGWAVFPVDHPELPNCVGAHRATPCDGKRGKHPCTAWSKDVCRTEADVYAAFSGRQRNYGISCGAAGLIVLDEDSQGEFARLCSDYGQAVPDTLRVLTAKGCHYYFTAPVGQPIGNETILTQRGYKIDVRGHGGFVVGAGSQHETGVHYVYADRDTPVATLPSFLADLLEVRRHDGDDDHASDPLDGEDKLWWRTGTIEDGNRDNALIASAGWCRAVGLDEQIGWMIVRNVWQRCEQPPIAGDEYPEEQARDKLRQAYQRWQPRTQADDPPVNPDQLDVLVEQFQARTKSTAELRNQPPPTWLIGGLITQGSLVQVFGPSGSFKSFYTLDMALCIATNTTFHGRDVHGGGVYYIAAEGTTGLAQRVRAWEKTYDIEVPDISPSGGVRWIDWPWQVTSASEFAALSASAERERPAAIFLDTRARVSIGLDENDAQDTGLLMQRLGAIGQQTGASLILVHHPGHGTTSRARGSSAAYAALDAEIKVDRRGSTPYVTVEGTKSKDWGQPEPEAFEFTIVDVPIDGDPMATSGVLRRLDDVAERDELPENLRLLDAVAELSAQGGATPSSLSLRLGMRKQKLRPLLDRHTNAGRLQVADGPRASTLYSLTPKGTTWLADRRTEAP